MPAYFVVDLSIHDRRGYAPYPAHVTPIIERHGGRVTHRLGDFEAVEDGWSPQRMVIIEFPDKAAARAFYDDPDYAPWKKLRMEIAATRVALGSGK